MDGGPGANLAFRLLRLTAPTLRTEPPKLTNDVADACHFQPMLQLPSSSDIMLGEMFSCYVRLVNLSDVSTSNIAIKCELQTGRQRLTLHDTAAKPLPRLAARGSHDFQLQHDVKEPNDHVLTCSGSYTGVDGVLRTEQQTLVFTATNPLSVRTKTRSISGNIWLEVCVENTGASPLFLDYVRLDPAAGAAAEQLTTAAETRSGGGDAAAILQRHIDALQVVAPGGAHNLLYQVKAPAAAAGRTGDAKTDLGKLEIKWRRSMGEAGRLQTQHIMLSGSAAPPVELRLTDVPAAVVLERPFRAALTLRNNLDRRLGPLLINFADLSPSGGAGESPFQVQGPQAAEIAELAPHSSLQLLLTLLPTATGVHTISGLSLVEAIGGQPVASLEPESIFVLELLDSAIDYNA